MNLDKNNRINIYSKENILNSICPRHRHDICPQLSIPSQLDGSSAPRGVIKKTGLPLPSSPQSMAIVFH